MSEPLSYVLSLVIPEWGMRSWLAAPLPAPDRWLDWADLDMELKQPDFDLVNRLSGRTIGAILDEWASGDTAGWHFAWSEGRLSLVALQGAESWREHLLFLCAVRAAGDHGAGPGAVVANGYIWQEGSLAWSVVFAADGTSRISSGIQPDQKAPLDRLAKPMIASVREGVSGVVSNDLPFWRGR